MAKTRVFRLETKEEFGELTHAELKTILANTFMDKLKTEGVKVTFKLEEVQP